MDHSRKGGQWEDLHDSGYVVRGVRRDPETGSRIWVFRRTAIPRLPRRVHHGSVWTIVLDVNRVLAAKWWDPAHAFPCHVRHGAAAFFARPGARKFCKAVVRAGHNLVLWSSMHRSSVDAVATLFAHTLALANEDAPRDEEHPELGADGRNDAIVKDCAVVWAALRTAHPSRTLLIEDDPRKARANPDQFRPAPRPLFEPPDPWHPQCVEDGAACRALFGMTRSLSL